MFPGFSDSMKRSRLLPEEVRSALSPLESQVLGLLKPGEEFSVRRVHERVSARKRVALTSVAVTLDRLYKMGLVDRRAETGRGGVHYLYTPRTSPREFERSMVKSAVDRLIERFGSTALAYFEERFGRRKR